jgi:hypothetical protein
VPTLSDPGATPSTGPSRVLVAVAWTLILGLSLAPRVVLQELGGTRPSPDVLLTASLGLIAVGLAGTVAWAPARALRPFLSLMAVLIGAQWFVHTRLDETAPFAAALRDASFGVRLLAEMGLNLVATGAVVATLAVIHRDRRRFFLAIGEPSAPAGPIPWMGVPPGARWNAVGRILSVAITLGTLAFLVVAGAPSLARIAAVGPFLPVVLLAAALNALNEELTYKASILSVLVGPLGPRDALRMTAAYFGIAHFYGVPYGLVGVILAWFLGWILAKSMLETRGLGWAWFIHFLQDVAIFGFLAVGAVVPGG